MEILEVNSDLNCTNFWFSLVFCSFKKSLKHLRISSMNLNSIKPNDFSTFVTGLESVLLDLNFLTFEQIYSLFVKVRFHLKVLTVNC